MFAKMIARIWTVAVKMQPARFLIDFDLDNVIARVAFHFANGAAVVVEQADVAHTPDLMIGVSALDGLCVRLLVIRIVIEEFGGKTGHGR